ncbi:MAG: tail fiber domain-containing protein [Nitrospirota bacterium]
MKKLVLAVLTGLLLMGMSAFAADGDLIVNGKVGVGTTSPVDRLDVFGNIRLVGGGYLQQVGGNYLRLNTDSGVPGSHIAFTRGATEIMRIDASGNVGIGTTNPTNPLTVDGTNYGGNDSIIVARSRSNYDMFSVLPWSGGTYIGSGAYYKDGVWIHSGTDATNALFYIGGTGGRWLASNNGVASWNVTGGSSILLWTASGVLQGASSRAGKENFEPLNFNDILHKINKLDITRWNYKTEGSEVKHIGPMAEDFREVFGVGESDKNIALIDEAGIALAGVKGLIERVKVQEDIITSQKDEISGLKKELSDIKSVLQKMAIQITINSNNAIVSQAQH